MTDSNVAKLVVEAPGKQDMLELLDYLRDGVEKGEILGLLVTAIGSGMRFMNLSSCDDISATSRIGYLMCHVSDLTHNMMSPGG